VETWVSGSIAECPLGFEAIPHQSLNVPCAMDNGDDVERFRVAQIEHHVGVCVVDMDRPGQQVVAEVADAGILRKAVEGYIEALFDIHAARPAGVFGDPIEDRGKVLLGVGREFIAGRHAQAVRESGWLARRSAMRARSSSSV